MTQLAKPGSLILAGWSTRDFTLRDLADYLEVLAPPIVEISKDLLAGLSIKNVHELLKAHGARCGHPIVSFAGTTDLTTCAGLSWNAYFDYLRIQQAQARFLGSRYFRLFAGETKDFAESELLTRLNAVEQLFAPTILVVELHGGWESTPAHLRTLVASTPCLFVVDFANGLSCGLSYVELSEVIPGRRIAYFHSRNLGGRYIEDTDSVGEEARWRARHPDIPVLWEPKYLSAQRIKELADGARTTH